MINNLKIHLFWSIHSYLYLLIFLQYCTQTEVISGILTSPERVPHVNTYSAPWLFIGIIHNPDCILKRHGSFKKTGYINNKTNANSIKFPWIFDFSKNNWLTETPNFLFFQQSFLIYKSISFSWMHYIFLNISVIFIIKSLIVSQDHWIFNFTSWYSLLITLCNFWKQN